MGHKMAKMACCTRIDIGIYLGSQLLTPDSGMSFRGMIKDKINEKLNDNIYDKK